MTDGVSEEITKSNVEEDRIDTNQEQRRRLSNGRLV